MYDLKKMLGTVFTGDLLDDAGSLTACANDASIFELVPKLVARPRGVADVKAIVRAVTTLREAGEEISLTPRAAGTGMAGGALTESVVLDMANLNQIREVSPEYAVVEPGVFFRDFEKATLTKNRIMPAYPASKELCTVGGMVATNAGGEKTLRYGSTERYVKSLRVVLADGNEYTLGPLSKNELDAKMNLQTFEGEVYRRTFNLLEKNFDAIKAAAPRVTKNSTGYPLWNVWDRTTFDLSKIFVGSEGTLGVVTEITFGLVEPRPVSKLLVMFVNDLGMLPEIVNKVLAHQPETFESYDDHTFRFAVRFFPDILRSLKARGLATLAFRFLPEVMMILRGGVPKLVLLAEFTGTEESEVLARAQQAERDIKHFGIRTKITTSRADAEKFWTIRHESFNLLRHHGGKKRTAPFIDDIIVAPEHLPAFLPRLTELMKQYGLTYTIAGHIGDGNMHVIPLMDLRDAREREIIFELGKKVFELVFEYSGSMSAEHNDGLIRTPFLKQMYGEAIYRLFEETKNIIDPRNIFNPGKKVFGKDIGVTKQYIDRVY